MSFQINHLATLSKYAGISFISGAVNHGMFSEQRSTITALIGIVLFVLGGFLEMRLLPSTQRHWGNLLGFGVLASIGLGFFTGGLQHFPDSPDRSVWVVPLGFFISLTALYFTDGRGQIAIKPFATYSSVASLVVVLGSWGASKYLMNHESTGHDHAHSHIQEATSVNTALTVIRDVVIEMDDTFRFTPATWQAQEGETIRLVVINKGKLKHELVLEKEKELIAHAQEMKQASKGHHHHVNAVSVQPGQYAQLMWTFKTAGTWGMACFEAGHYEAGMKGDIVVTQKQ
ncbi:MAG: hypothetical protein EBT78_11315 [Betaproteobacteria bacterium]|nr:hypothetical protein [Betaproteobacteria bacterium]NBT68336.1 hypothetical protein [Betaproteobacteria bacterium]NBY06780.1 hypothetical protein [Betaproteobacteria bacterium]